MRLPKISPNTARATAQPTNAPRCSRHTRPAGLSSVRVRRGAAAPLRPQPRPTSRRPASATATASRNARAATARSSGHQWSPPKGRVCWPQPIGDSQAGQALVTRSPARSTVPSMLPMPLSTNATPRTPAAIPVAPRVVEDSWQVTAATPTKTSPTAATAAPASNEPAAGWPAAIASRQHERPARGGGPPRRPRRRGRRTGRRRQSRAARRVRAPRPAGCAGPPRRCSSGRPAPRA